MAAARLERLTRLLVVVDEKMLNLTRDRRGKVVEATDVRKKH
jgi:hypothetical protein